VYLIQIRIAQSIKPTTVVGYRPGGVDGAWYYSFLFWQPNGKDDDVVFLHSVLNTSPAVDISDRLLAVIRRQQTPHLCVVPTENRSFI
jgi:hypothetical protein